ncbi:MAG: ferritin-like domain-containing protein [Dehalococcoidia bacterium]|nr:ferritin-like domain-containing protein [Dehalococcoidia bacterium]
MAIDVDTLQKLREESAEPAPLDLTWLNLDENGHPWGMRAKPGKRGLTLDEIEIGPAGEVPVQSDNRAARVRGSVPRHDAMRVPGAYAGRADVYSENTRLLYEEAVQRQWSSATDIPWEGIQPLPDDIERAMCQLCTFLTEVEFIAGDTPGQWLPKINSEHHEVKLFLLSQIMDEARHLDVFRKRAFANGGGLLSSLPQDGLRVIIDAKDFTEMSAIMHVAAEGFVQSMFRMGEYIGQNDAEKRIFRMCGQDESRHLGFGVMHLKYVMDNEPWRREEIHHYLDKVETTLVPDPMNSDGTNFALFEALAILMAGGVKNLDKGIQMSMQVQKKRVNEYMHRLTVAGLGDRRQRMSPMLRQFLDN